MIQTKRMGKFFLLFVLNVRKKPSGVSSGKSKKYFAITKNKAKTYNGTEKLKKNALRKELKITLKFKENVLCCF